jgi:hypothetical protein
MSDAQTVQVEPMAAVSLLSAEKDFYRNRCLLLEHEVVLLRRQLEAIQAKDVAPPDPAHPAPATPDAKHSKKRAD